MAINKSDIDRTEELRKRRRRLAEARENQKKRAQYGAIVIEKVKFSLDANLDDYSFKEDRDLPVEFKRQPNFADCLGLVAAHRSEEDILSIIKCCDRELGRFSGIVGFDDYSFMGTAKITSTNFEALFELAKSLHDSVLFCPTSTKGIILVDHYKVKGVSRDFSFSIVIQGTDLEAKLAKCFENVVPIQTMRSEL